MGLLPKGNKVYSILNMKCPRCNEGDLFENKNPYKISGFFNMPEKCPHCNQKYELEPAFYYGAMYASYAIGVAWFVAVFVALMVLYPDFSVQLYLLISVGGMIALTPLFFKLARALWINLFVHYDKDATSKAKDI